MNIYEYEDYKKWLNQGNEELKILNQKNNELKRHLSYKQKKGNLDLIHKKAIEIIEKMTRTSTNGFVVKENIEIINSKIKTKRVIIKNILEEISRCVPILLKSNEIQLVLNDINFNGCLEYGRYYVFKYKILEIEYYYKLVIDREEKETEKEVLKRAVSKFIFIESEGYTPYLAEKLSKLGFTITEELEKILRDLHVEKRNGKITKKEQETIERAYKYIYKIEEKYEKLKNSKDFQENLYQHY